jgi:hypothetical protein
MERFNSSNRGARRSELRLANVLVYLVENGPGRTETQLAEAIFADKAYQQRVNQACVRLANSGEIERRGAGGPADPYTDYSVPPQRR